MTIEEALVQFLKSSPNVAELIGGTGHVRIYPEEAPQDAEFPHITYQLIDHPQYYSLSGPSGLCYPRIQIDCWAQGPSGKRQVVKLAEAVRTAKGGNNHNRNLDGFAGYMSQLYVNKCELVDRTYSSEPPIHANDHPYRRASLDFVIHYQEREGRLLAS